MIGLQGRSVRRFAVVVAALALVAAACSESHGTDAVSSTTVPTTPADTAAATASPAGPVAVEVAAFRGGLSGYDIEAVAWNGYWYSRYNLGSVVMMAGLGVPLEPPMEAVMQMVAAVDQGPDEGEHVVMPANAGLIRAVYAGGDATFANAFNGDPMDFTNWRWSPDAFDTRLIPSAQAQTILKELEWAKLFNNGGWAGAPTDSFGAMDRFKGIVLFAEAKAQARFALDELRNGDGFFVAEAQYDGTTVTPSGGTAADVDQFQMLIALSDLRLTLQQADSFNGVYGDPAYLAVLAPEVDGLFELLEAVEPSDVLGMSQAAQAMVWFAASTEDASLRSRALDRLSTLGDALAAVGPNGPVEQARAIRGLMESARVLDDEDHRDRAVGLFVEMMEGYDGATGSFAGVTRLTTWEVGDIIGALNSLRFNAADAVRRGDVETALTGFFEATVNRGGLLRAAPPKEMEASPFEIDRLGDDVYFAYPGIPTPDAAGGPNGSAAVDVAVIGFDVNTGVWSPIDTGYDTAGAMHTSNEMFWVWGFQNGFPVVPGSERPEESEVTDGVIEVVATEFAFDLPELNLTPGDEVTLRLRNEGAVVHNLEITEYGVLVEAAPGEFAEITFVVPEGTPAANFFCNIPGHREAGMEATVTSG